MTRYELAVVGAGPGGIAAATAASAAGVATILLDSQPQPGGQYYRASADGPVGRRATQRSAALAGLADAKVDIINNALVWGIFPDPGGAGWELAFDTPTGSEAITANTVILATGAYDRSIPFPGWTLPGVLTAGAVQTLLKGSRVLPGKRVLLSGTGPLQLAAAAELTQAGAEVVAVLEAARFTWRAVRHLGALQGQGSRIAEGWDYVRTLRSARVPVRVGWSVIAARGASEVEEAVICPVDAAGRPNDHAAETLAVDTIVVGYGLLPSSGLARLAGCAEEFRPELGGYAPQRDARMETSRRGVYAAGDGASIGGAALAEVEGAIAGTAVAERLGKLSQKAAREVFDHHAPVLARERRFGRMLGALFTPGPGLYTLADDDTVICRCEGVTLGDIRRVVRDGALTVNEVKGLTRAGMGDCQGRVCEALIAGIIAIETAGRADDSAALQAAGRFTARAPQHPISVADLAALE